MRVIRTSSFRKYYRGRRAYSPYRKRWRERWRSYNSRYNNYYTSNLSFKGMRNIIEPLPTVWNNIRQNNIFSDAVIESADKTTFRVHRVILAASSDYFRAVFSNPLRESSYKVLLDFPSNIVDRLVEFCYTGTCKVNTDNAESLLAAADELGIIGLIELICSFMQSHINVKNCWRTHVFCKTYFCGKLASEARRYLLDHFLEFFQEGNEFLTMSKDEAVDLLSDDFLNVRREELVFIAADKWIRHDVETRLEYASDLLLCIRVNFMHRSYYLENILRAPYIDHVVQPVKNLMTKAVNAPPIKLKALSPSSHKRLVDPAPPFPPRVPYNIVFAIGGWSNGLPTNCIETYDSRANLWFPCHKRDFLARAYHGVICVDNLIYIIGGFNGSLHFNSVRCFDPVFGLWSEKSCMHRSRCYVSCVELGGYIYAIGGYNGNERLNQVERYNIFKNQWEEVAPMKRPRSDAGATVFRNMIYIAGGFNGHNVLTSAEVYDPKFDIWTSIVRLNHPRSGVSLITYKGFIYALGGFDGLERLRSVERFHPDFHSWDQSVPMRIPRSNFSCTILEDVIFVVGGFNGNVPIPNSEYFDGSNWYPLAQMEIHRSALAICTVSGLPNAEIYSYAGNVQSRNSRKS